VIRYLGLFVEVAATAIVPNSSSNRPGASDAGILGICALRGGITILFL
jgi:hypothetical protein